MLDAFRSYIYYGNVTGSLDAGLGVSANTATDAGQNNQVTYSGTAGGFEWFTVKWICQKQQRNRIKLCNWTEQRRWLCRDTRKSGSCEMEAGCAGNNTGQLLGGALGVLDIFGSTLMTAV